MCLERIGLGFIIPTREGVWILSLTNLAGFKGLHNCLETLVIPLRDCIWDEPEQHLLRSWLSWV